MPQILLATGGPDCGEAYQSQLIASTFTLLVTFTPAAREALPFLHSRLKA
jgi:hypothetical protein